MLPLQHDPSLINLHQDDGSLRSKEAYAVVLVSGVNPVLYVLLALLLLLVVIPQQSPGRVCLHLGRLSACSKINHDRKT